VNLIPDFKTAATPGSIQFFVVAVVAGALWAAVWPRRARLAIAWIVGICGLYLVLGLPVVANLLAGPRPEMFSRANPPLTTVVVFDGDNRVGRAREAERLNAATSPQRIWVLGGAWLSARLISDGVPRDRITRDRATANTRDQIAALRRIVQGPGTGRVGVVASRLQMPRVAALVRTAGLDVVLCPSLIDAEPPTTGLRRFLPTYIALRVSRDSIYEDAAIVLYRWRGWISASAPPRQNGDAHGDEPAYSAAATSPLGTVRAGAGSRGVFRNRRSTSRWNTHPAATETAMHAGTFMRSTCHADVTPMRMSSVVTALTSI
jgi:uncharacterized SAM-binding protein YcdF (DUF218 family)